MKDSDLTTIEIAAADPPLIPDGTYECRVFNIEGGMSRTGMLTITFDILEGPFAGRKIFDFVSFDDPGLRRAKLLFEVCFAGVDSQECLDIECLVGKEFGVTVLIDGYYDRNGERVFRNVVPFSGYSYPRS